MKDFFNSLLAPTPPAFSLMLLSPCKLAFDDRAHEVGAVFGCC